MAPDTDPKKQFSERLITSIAENGWKFFGAGTRLAKLLNVSTKMGTNYLNGESLPSDDKILVLAKHLNVHPHWLRYGTGPKQYTGGMEETPALEAPATHAEPLKNPGARQGEIELPFLTEIASNEWEGATRVAKSPNLRLKISRSVLESANTDPDRAACIEISGDSMEPTLPDGAIIAIDTDDKIVRDGMLYALDHRGQLRVKKLTRQPGNGLRILSLNPLYPPEEYSPADIESGKIRILGRAFWYTVQKHL